MRGITIIVVAVGLSLFGPSGFADVASTAKRPTTIPAQGLETALETLAKEYKFQILYRTELVGSLRTNGATGELTPDEALRQLLDGTGLTYRYLDEKAVTIVPVETALKPAASSALSAGAPGKDAAGDFKLARVVADPPGTARETADTSHADEKSLDRAATEKQAGDSNAGELVVTGSHIRGLKESTAPSMVITRDDIDNSGSTTVEALFRNLPQNFSEVSAEGVRTEGGSRLAGFNGDRATGVDLRGLGADSTLTLLNGQRRAGSIDGRVVDISLIPLAIIERVDIVTDGRSAIYGSDAVGGVVNFITRREFQGAQTDISYAHSRGGSENLQLNQIVGANPSRGGFVAAYGYEKGWKMNLVELGGIARIDPFDTEQIYIGQPQTLRHSAFASGHFPASETVELRADALFSRKEMDNNDIYLYPGAANNSFELTRYASDHLGVSAGAAVTLGESWAVDVSGAYSQLEQELSFAFEVDLGGFGFADASTQFNTISIATLAAVADGPLPRFAGIQPRAAFGADYRKEDRDLYTTGIDGRDPLARNVRSLFGEVHVPLVEERTHPGLQRLELSLAGRYDDYSDFGGTFNPQAGAMWQPVDGLTFKGNYSSSFRAPALTDMGRTANGRLANFTDSTVAGGSSPVLLLSGSNPDIGPEQARSWSFSIDYQPPLPQYTRLSVSYFDIRYQDRLDIPAIGVDQSLILEREDRFVGLLERQPSAARVDEVLASLNGPPRNNTGRPYDPDTGSLLAAFPDLVIFDNRTNNIAVETTNGLDLLIETHFPVSVGALSVRLNGIYTLSHERRITASSPPFGRVNEVGKPSSFRVRSHLGWTGDALSGYLYLNHIKGYVNPFTSPFSAVDSWTTVDATFRCESLPSTGGWLSGISLTLSAQNLLNAAPPAIAESASALLYDPANASALGRHFSVQLLKKW